MDEVTRRLISNNRAKGTDSERLAAAGLGGHGIKELWKRRKSTNQLDASVKREVATKSESFQELAAATSTTGSKKSGASNKFRAKVNSIRSFSNVGKESASMRKTRGLAPGNTDRGRSASRSRTKGESPERNGARRGSADGGSSSSKDSGTNMKRSDSLERLMQQVRQLNPKIVIGDADDEKKKAEEQNISAITAAFSEVGKRKSFKKIAQELKADPDEKRLASKVVAAFGAKKPPKKEEGGDDEDDIFDCDFYMDENQKRIRDAKPKYMDMYSKQDKVDKEEGEDEEKDAAENNPVNFGLWDTAARSIKLVPTLMRVKKEWQPPDWEQTLKKMKEEGMDIASIDADLKDITKQQELAMTKTGKYMMPDDIQWCRKHTKFKEKDLLNWFRKFRAESPTGVMSKAQFKTLFQLAFPVCEPEVMADTVFEIFQQGEEVKDGLDFKVRPYREYIACKLQ